MRQPLKDIIAIDLTSRLPGPLATKVLADLGANLKRVEDTNYPDPFKDSELASFRKWYESLNKSKETICLDFRKEEDKLKKIIQTADIIICSSFCRSMIEEALKESSRPIAIVEVHGGREENKHLHDINALAMSSTFNMHLEDSANPPYLPFAGISFAQYISTLALATLLEARSKQKPITNILYLEDITSLIFDTFTVDQTDKRRFLHNGLFPCYQVYKLKDGEHLCLAAVEEKFWKEFVSCFRFNLLPSDRFDESGRTQAYLEAEFLKLDSNDIQLKTKGKSLCMNIVKK